MYSIVGIDFGTSTTVVRIRNCDDESIEHFNAAVLLLGIRSLKDINGEDSFPTVIFKRAGGHVLYGHEAENSAFRRRRDGDELIRNFKMDLLAVDIDKQEKAKRYVRHFFGFIKQRIDEQRFDLGLEDKLVVAVSVPAKWPKDVRDFMRSVTFDVGLAKSTDEVRVIDEPTAASRATLMGHLPDLVANGILGTGKFNVVMVDMGAGTSDLVIFKLTIDGSGQMHVDSQMSYPTVDNPNLCGGREIDEILCNYVVSVGGETAVKNRTRIEYALKKFKENHLSLALKNGETVDIRDEMYFEGDAYSNLEPITPDLFLKMTMGHWESWDSVVKAAMSESKRRIGIGPDDVDLVILTGGHSFWYLVSDYFSGKNISSIRPLPFRKIRQSARRILCEVNRSATVANGLALGEHVLPFVKTSANRYSLVISVGGVENPDEKVVADACSILPLSTEVEFNGMLSDGYEAYLIPVQVVLKCGSQFGTMREIIREGVEIARPDNAAPKEPLRWKSVMKAGVDDAYRVQLFGLAVAMRLDESGQMIGVPKYTEFDLVVGDES